jgi:hypothetical protein
MMSRAIVSVAWRWIMRRLLAFCVFVLVSLSGLATAQAGVEARVDLGAQRMIVRTSDGETHNWAISSGRAGYRTPTGTYRPIRLEKKWYSRKYGGNMPNAVFFRGGYAVHATGAIGALGRPASHGCIRLHPANAAKFFALVQKHGKGATRIALTGTAPDGNTQFAKAKTRNTQIAKAKIRNPVTIAKAKRGSGGADWNTAREQLFLKPGLPPSAYGYQPMPPSQR